MPRLTCCLHSFQFWHKLDWLWWRPERGFPKGLEQLLWPGENTSRFYWEDKGRQNTLWCIWHICKHQWSICIIINDYSKLLMCSNPCDRLVELLLHYVTSLINSRWLIRIIWYSTLIYLSFSVFNNQTLLAFYWFTFLRKQLKSV